MIIRHYLGTNGHEFIPENEEEVEFLATADKEEIEKALSVIITQSLCEARVGKTVAGVWGLKG